MASSVVLARRNLRSQIIAVNQNYSMNGKVIVSALAILFVIIFIIIFLRIYANWLRCRSSISGRLHHSLFSQDTPLEREIVEVLPIFTYKSPCLSAATKASEAVECAVCLLDFRQDETCKLLPNCKHFFHLDCIDMWFLSNATCPLCRAAADPNLDYREGHDVGGSMSCCYTKQDGGNESGEHYQRPVALMSGTRDDIACDSGNKTLLRDHFSLKLPATSRNYRRSKSEKFSKGTHGTDSFFGGNHTHTTPRMNRTCWKTGGKSFCDATIDILKPQDSLVEVLSGPSSLTGSADLSHLVRYSAMNSSH